MGKEHDVIVVGSGQNGLSTAAYLAKAGLDVVVLEDKSWLGGSTCTKEVTVPGFKHEIGAVMNMFTVSSPTYIDDELGLRSKYGWETVSAPEPGVTHLYDDDTALPIYCDLDKMCECIAEYSQHDADAYRKFVNWMMPMLPLMAAGQFNAPPRMGALLNQLDQTTIGQDFMKLLFMSSWELARQWFEHPKTIILMMNYSSEAMVNPEEGGSAFYVLANVAAQHVPGMATVFPRGGMSEMVDSLVRCIEDHGGTVLTNHEVVKITTKGGRAIGVICSNGEEFTARKAIIPSVDPRLSLNKWLDTPLETGLREKIDRISDPPFVGQMTHIALDQDPVFKAGGDSNIAAQTLTLCTDLEKFRKYFDDMRYNRIPKPEKLLGVITTRADSTRAPEGKAVLYLWQFVPYSIADGGAARWDSVKEEVSNEAIKKYFSFTTNLTEKNILGKYVMSPVDFERGNQNMLRGHVLGPAVYLYQNMAYRPIPELGQYRTPVEGLYLAGQSVHPGGGVTLGGRAVAQVVMQDLGIDFDDVIA